MQLSKRFIKNHLLEILGIIFLFFSVLVGLYLLKNKQELRSKASGVGDNLEQFIEDVPSALGYRYGAADNRGNSLGNLQVTENPEGGYLGVYFSQHTDNVFYSKLATSRDLLNWTYTTDIDDHAGFADIEKLSNGGFLVVYQKIYGWPRGDWVRIRYYRDNSSFLSGTYQKEFNVPQDHSIYEQVPNIYSVTLSPDIDHSTIEIGYVWYDTAGEGMNKMARGTLTNFNSWTSHKETNRDEKLYQLGARGEHGQRDDFVFEGKQYDVQEAQLINKNWSTWRIFLYDNERGEYHQLNIRTHRGSGSFANPTFSDIITPNGEPGFIASFFLPYTDVAPGEAPGTLIFYKEYTTPNILPDGYLGEVNCTEITGWATEQDNQGVPTKVDFWDLTRNEGFGSTTANICRSDLASAGVCNNAQGGSGCCGFSSPFPDGKKNGTTYKISAAGIDSQDANLHTWLKRPYSTRTDSSPFEVTCTATPTPTPTPDVSPTPIPSPSPLPSIEPSPSPTPNASPTPTPIVSPSPNVSPLPPVSPAPKPADFNNNGRVDIFDYNIFVDYFLSPAANDLADFNHNGTVDIFDYNIFVDYFLQDNL